MEEWPFQNPPNTACLTLWRILKEGRPVLYVVCDIDDGMFQFLDGEPMRVSDAALVSLKEMLKLDETLFGVSALKPGWFATRDGLTLPWKFKMAELEKTIDRT